MHPHFHIIFTDGVFHTEEQTLQFSPVTILQSDIKRTEVSICHRVLRYLEKKGVLTTREDAYQRK